MLEGEGPYAAAWRSYRRTSWAFWSLFVFYLPGLAFVSNAFGLTRDGGGTITVAALLWLLLFAVIGYRKSNFSCPRCGELFFHKFDDRRWRRDWKHNPFARRCMHCGLPKWENSPMEFAKNKNVHRSDDPWVRVIVLIKEQL